MLEHSSETGSVFCVSLPYPPVPRDQALRAAGRSEVAA